MHIVAIKTRNHPNRKVFAPQIGCGLPFMAIHAEDVRIRERHVLERVNEQAGASPVAHVKKSAAVSALCQLVGSRYV